MSKFTVIAGGGKPLDPYESWAREHFRRTVIEILRALARGEDHTGRVLAELNEFLRHVQEMGPRDQIHQAVDSVFESMSTDLASVIQAGRADETRQVVVNSLRVAAETCAQDDGARARKSRRMSELQASIECLLVDREERARAHGGSCLRNLLSNYLPSKRRLRKKSQRRKRSETRLRKTLAALRKKLSPPEL
jgi:hypothetical protein